MSAMPASSLETPRSLSVSSLKARVSGGARWNRILGKWGGRNEGYGRFNTKGEERLDGLIDAQLVELVQPGGHVEISAMEGVVGSREHVSYLVPTCDEFAVPDVSSKNGGVRGRRFFVAIALLQEV